MPGRRPWAHEAHGARRRMSCADPWEGATDPTRSTDRLTTRSCPCRLLLNRMVEEKHERPTVTRLRGPGGSDTARPRCPAVRRGCHGGRTRRAVCRDPSGGQQTPQGSRRRRPGDSQQAGTTPAGAPRARGVLPDDQVDRAVSATGGGALPASRCRPGRAVRPGSRIHPSAEPRSSIMTTPIRHAASAQVEADPKLPLIRITRDFAATPDQLFRAHTDPGLYARWVGPRSMTTRIDHWEARSGGSWRFVSERDGQEFAFRGCFHEVRPDRIVQTFTW